MGNVMSPGKSRFHRVSRLLYGYKVSTTEQHEGLGHNALHHMPKELHAVAYSPNG